MPQRTTRWAWVRAFPDARITVHNEIVGGEWVVQEFTFTGTHEDTLMSPAGEIAPTHKTLTAALCRSSASKGRPSQPLGSTSIRFR